jgi:hypothetical protein
MAKKSVASLQKGAGKGHTKVILFSGRDDP